MTHETNEAPPLAKPRQKDALYLAAVGALLVLICGALAVLWLRERGQRIAAQNESERLRARLAPFEQMEKMGGQSLLSLGMPAPGAGEQGVQPVQREALSMLPEKVECAGQRRDVRLVPAELGRRLGFRAGDLILVTGPPGPEAPATQPAADTRPKP